MEIRGKTAVVTGAARGIGKTIAENIADAGVNIALFDILESEANKTAEELTARGIKAKVFCQDVTNVEDMTGAFKDVVEEFGSLDILVNNAGITRDNLLMRMSDEEWDSVLRVNLKSVFACTKAASRIMMKQRAGRIINIASVIGVMGNAGQANYAASKAGIIGFTKSIAKELASRGITCNAIAPGYIQTAMTDKLADEVKEQMLKSIPLNRMGTPEDVAKTVLFFASDLADYITGQVVNVDGGMVM